MSGIADRLARLEKRLAQRGPVVTTMIPDWLRRLSSSANETHNPSATTTGEIASAEP